MHSVGLEICLQVCENLTKNPQKDITDLLYHLVKNGKLGHKAGEGFYRFENNSPVGESAYIKRKIAKKV